MVPFADCIRHVTSRLTRQPSNRPYDIVVTDGEAPVSRHEDHGAPIPDDKFYVVKYRLPRDKDGNLITVADTGQPEAEPAPTGLGLSDCCRLGSRCTGFDTAPGS